MYSEQDCQFRNRWSPDFCPHHPSCKAQPEGWTPAKTVKRRSGTTGRGISKLEFEKERSGTTTNTDSFTYDAASRMLTGVKGEYSNTVAFTYDVGGRKATEALTIAGQTYSVGTAYDTAGREQTLTYPDGTTVGRTYDSRNLLSTIAYGGGNIDIRTYDAGGRLSSETLGNGQVVTRTYLAGWHRLARSGAYLCALAQEVRYDATLNHRTSSGSATPVGSKQPTGATLPGFLCV